MWVPVSKELPVRDGEYLVTIGLPWEEQVVKVAYYTADNKLFGRSGVTAWRELPPAYTKMVEDGNDETFTLTFRETVEARLHCTANTCDGCILHGDRCRKTDLAAAVNGWLERILDKLDNAGKKMDEITDREWIELLG